MDKNKLKELAGRLQDLASELDDVVYDNEKLVMYVAHDGSVEDIEGYTREIFRCYFSVNEVEIEVVGDNSMKALASLLGAKIREE